MTREMVWRCWDYSRGRVATCNSTDGCRGRLAQKIDQRITKKGDSVATSAKFACDICIYPSSVLIGNAGGRGKRHTK